MRKYVNRHFAGLVDRDSGRVLEDLMLHRCSFTGCALSLARAPELRTTVRNARLEDCEVAGCLIQSAIVEDVDVHNLASPDLVSTWGAVFNRVVLRGRFGRLLLSPLIDSALIGTAQQAAFDLANAAYYRNVQWALDISQLEAEEVDIRGVPAHLIRRDKATQVVVRREKAMSGSWRRLDLSGTYWPTYLEDLPMTDQDATVLVAPKASPLFDKLLGGLNRLREAEVAEAD